MTGLQRTIAAIWVLATLSLGGMVVADVDPQVRLYYSNVLQVLSSVGCGIVCLMVMEAFPSASPLRAAWGLIGAGVMAWGIGATIFAGYPLLNGGEDTPYPYFSDIGYLMTSPLIALGLMAFKRGAGLVAPLWGKVLALLVLLVSGYWGYYANNEGLSGEGLAMSLSSLGYMLFDPILLMVTVLTACSFTSGVVGAAWWKVVIGVALYFFANQAYTFFTLNESYMTGSWIDMGWMLGFGMIAWAALTARRIMA